jgi:tight adherence protein B
VSPGAVVTGSLVGLALLAAHPFDASSRLAAMRSGNGPSDLGTRKGPRRAFGKNRFETTSGAVVDLLEGLAAELTAGRPPGVALRRVCDDIDDQTLAEAMTSVGRASAVGGDVAAQLVFASAARGCQALRWLAAAWHIGESTGAGLASVVERVASAARAEADHRREVGAQLAAPRATARMLALLPVLGLVIGELLGASPVSVLFSTPTGCGCLVAGVSLELLGIRWTDRLAAAAERA